MCDHLDSCLSSDIILYEKPIKAVPTVKIMGLSPILIYSHQHSSFALKNMLMVVCNKWNNPFTFCLQHYYTLCSSFIFILLKI